MNVLEVDKSQYSIKDAIEIAKINFNLLCKGVKENRPWFSRNVIAIGPSGCGKTASSQELFKELFGVKSLPEGVYKYKSLKIAFREIHGGSWDVNTTMIPIIKQSTEITPEVDGLLKKADAEKSQIKRQFFLEMAKETLSKTLDYALENFFENVILANNVDIACFLIQDINKNPDPGFNNMLKSLVDRKIGSRQLPPTFIYMTANPYDSQYINNAIDVTVLSTASVLNVTHDEEEGIYYASRNLPLSRTFFEENTDMLYLKSTSNVEGSATIRSWDAAMEGVAELIKDEKEDLIPVFLKAKVGEAAAKTFCIWYLKNKKELVPDIIDKTPEYIEYVNKVTTYSIDRDVNKVISLAISAPKSGFYVIKQLIDGLSENLSKLLLFKIYNNDALVNYIKSNPENSYVIYLKNKYISIIET